MSNIQKTKIILNQFAICAIKSNLGYLFILSLLLCTSFNSSAKVNLKRSYYNKYNETTFETAKPFNDTIDPKNIDRSLLNAAIFHETNRQRVLNDKEPFIYSLRLNWCAQAHSNDMVKHRFYSHTSPVKGKRNMTNRIKRFGIRYSYAAENIADYPLLQFDDQSYYPPSQKGNFTDLQGNIIGCHTYLSFAKYLVNGWMNSPGHRKNILYPRHTHLGVGVGLHYTGKGTDRIPRIKSTQNFVGFKK